MTRGQPCPNCNTMLRFFPQLDQWGCDQCRQMFPKDLPRAVAPPKQQQWRKLPFIVIGALIVAAGGVVAALKLFGGSAKPSATELRDELVRQTFASLASGDHGGLVSRSGLGNIMAHASCANGEMPDVSKDLSDFSEQVDRAIARAKGATFEIVSIDEPEPAKRLAKGDELAKGCKLDIELVQHQLAVKVKITRDKPTTEAIAKLALVELKGKIYAISPPLVAGGCDAAVARIALVGARDAQDADLASSLQPALILQCESEKWPAPVVDCLAKVTGLTEVPGCIAKLAGDQQSKLRDALAAQLTAQTPAATALRAIVPGAAPPTPATSDAAITLGKPEAAELGDFWLWPRSDGKYLVASPYAEVVFPHKPTIAVVNTPLKRGDGTTVEDFQLNDVQGDLRLQVELISNGYGLKDPDIAKSMDNMRQQVAKVGTVTESKRDDRGLTVYGFAATDKANAMLRVETRVDRARGFSMSATAVTPSGQAAIGDAFFASAHLRHAPDPLKDASTLEGVRIRKAGKKLVAHDKTDSFTIELPWTATVERKFKPDLFMVGVVIKSHKSRRPGEEKEGEIRLLVDEFGSWDGLGFGPTGRVELANRVKASLKSELGEAVDLTDTVLAGLPASRFESKKGAAKKIEAWSVWNRFQHRLYQILCVDAPQCEASAKSLRFADPAPVN